MAEISRNAPCPCGSGKKYKRCCIDKQHPITEDMLRTMFDKTAERELEEESKAHEVFRKYDAKELLKIFSLIQLQPGNHGKNIRIESAIVDIINNPTSSSGKLNLPELSDEIRVACKRNYAEDPPEEFFTENIVFTNGNNTVFPGIATNSTEIVQPLLNCILAQGDLPENFLNEVSEGVLLLLYIHNEIANSLGYTYRLFEENNNDELHIPGESEIKNKISLFEFTVDKINMIADTLKIAMNTFYEFVFGYGETTAKSQSSDANPLLQQPFIFLEDRFILVMPTAELTCINDFILTLAKKHNCLDTLLVMFSGYCHDELLPYFGRMDWDQQRFTFPSGRTSERPFITHEVLWRIDTNKLAYCIFITVHPDFIVAGQKDIDFFSAEFSKITKHSCEAIKEKFPHDALLLVSVTHKARVLGVYGLALGTLTYCDHAVFFSLPEIQVLARVWTFDRLTLWKYSKYLHLAEDKIRFAPGNTHYSKFKWYVRNEESFFDPDEAKINMAAFEFEIESEVRRDGIAKIDRIAIPFLNDDHIKYIQCYRKEKYYPAYISQAINYGLLNNCFLKYKCPFWIMSAKGADHKTDVYINGILYWLNELYDYAAGYLNLLGELPVLFIIRMDEQLYDLKEIDPFDNSGVSFKFSIDKKRRTIEFVLPVQLVQYIASPDNFGEQYLMAFILDMAGNLMKQLGVGDRLAVPERDRIINLAIPRGNKKMITTATNYRDPNLADIDIEEPRIISKADVSFVLENQVPWLNYDYTIPRKIETKKEKIKLLNDIVSVHVKSLKQLISRYEGVSLLLFVMKRHESLLHERSFRKINYPVKLACYGQYYNVYEEFAKTETDLNVSNLSMRVLIEFIACIMPTGSIKPNDDDLDIMLAHMRQLVQYGSMSDELQYDIRDMEVGLLPSGRIGIDRAVGKKGFDNFSDQVYGKEFDEYGEDYEQFFRRNNLKKAPEPGHSEEVKKIDQVFQEQWGIALYDIGSISLFLTTYLFNIGKSVHVMTEKQLTDTLRTGTDLNDIENSSYIRQMTFLKRDDILTAPDGFNKTEIYPWRYNRRLSYLAYPLIKLDDDKGIRFIISARHLWSATENLIANFGQGILRVAPGDKVIAQLIAQENVKKGKEYRYAMYQWLIDNTTLKVIPHEVTISPRGFLKAKEDKGDIDILAIDEVNCIIYSIECKNTSQSKVAYEFRLEIDNYLGIPPKTGLIQKHINRDKWLKEKLDSVKEKLGLTGDYKIKSMVISKYVLPTKFLTTSTIAIMSFHEVKKTNFFNVSEEDRNLPLQNNQK